MLQQRQPPLWSRTPAKSGFRQVHFSGGGNKAMHWAALRSTVTEKGGGLPTAPRKHAKGWLGLLDGTFFDSLIDGHSVS